jgi:carboxypeptidase C (cathepsin A)
MPSTSRRLRSTLSLYLFFSLVSLLPWAPAAAQHPQGGPEAKAVPAPAEALPLKETLSETRHSVTVGGRPLAYRALAGDLVLSDGGGKPKARMFYVAYLKDIEKGDELRRRPLTFIWNGGPGSSAVWLHLGALGPQRVDVDPDGIPAPPPHRLLPNPHTLLDVSDLVFVDPVSTGYSRPAPGEEEKQFHNVQGDVEWMGELIRRFMTRHGRWGSPIFLLGESYGTIRAAGLADYLQRRFSLYLNGVALISPALSQQTYIPGGLNDLPYILTLPGFTATAWYHKKLPPELQADLQKAVREAEDFAFGDYSDALARGASLAPEKKTEIAARFARLTGLQADEVERLNLRVGNFLYAFKLFEKEKRQVGVLDSRYWGYVNQMATESFAPAYAYATYDPSMSRVDGTFAAAWQQYLHEDLNVKNEEAYEILSMPTAISWDYKGVENRYLFTADNLRVAMTLNPDLKVFVASGTFDLVTTALSARYVLDHLDIDPGLRKNLTFAEYPGGHMMYMHEPSLARLKKDLAAFYEAATARTR